MIPVLLPPRRTRASASAPEGHQAPRRVAQPPTAREIATPPAGAAYDPLRLLIVDDDFLFADMLPRLLRRRILKPALEMASATNAEDAMRRLDAERYHVLLCDYDLKASSTGLDVLAHAARQADGPFRILITGHSPREIPETGHQLYDAFLDKPMTLREVVPQLTTLLHARLGVGFETKD